MAEVTDTTGKLISTEKDILDTLFEYADATGLVIDSDFDLICEAYEISEDDLMGKMVASEKYNFGRITRGFSIAEVSI